ncbi:MAG TPA: chemotaxis protein CheC [Candidatus Methylomirabilis sp.]|nr:chemotaxis protein CheC [Candidatus Methylomirabilis sp.]HSC71649.1 chemotaxis protein CheC [Candidatus Methylomirabilis sp.]
MAERGGISQPMLRRFRAVSNRSMRRAGETLTALLGHPVRLEVSHIQSVAAGDLPDLAAEAAVEELAGLRFQITGEAGGEMVLLLPRPTICKILQVLLSRGKDARPLSVEERSAIQEVGNILASSFLNEMGDLLGKRLLPSPPEFHIEDIPQLIQQVVETVKEQGSEVLVVHGLFEDPDQEFTGRFFVLPEMASLLAMIRKAGDGAPRR